MGGNLADFAPCCQESAKACLPRGRRAAHQKNQIKSGQKSAHYAVLDGAAARANLLTQHPSAFISAPPAPRMPL